MQDICEAQDHLDMNEQAKKCLFYLIPASH